MALEKPPANPGEDSHAQRVPEVEHPAVYRVRRLGLGNGLDEEGCEGVERVLVHVVDEAPAEDRRCCKAFKKQEKTRKGVETDSLY